MNDKPGAAYDGCAFCSMAEQSTVKMQPARMDSRRPADTREALAKSGARGTIGNLAMVTARRARLATSPSISTRRWFFAPTGIEEGDCF